MDENNDFLNVSSNYISSTRKKRLKQLQNNYYKGLDALRVLACFLVFFYHLGLIRGGYLAVCTFFVLTGFLRVKSAIGQNAFSLKKYFFNRIKKIYIPLIVVVFSTIILAKIIPNIRWFNLKRESISVLLGYNNFWQLSANLDYFAKHINSPFMHFWYISILMQFELVFPILFLFFKKIVSRSGKNIVLPTFLSITLFATALFVYLSLTQNIMVAYYNSFARSFSILFGISLALAHYYYGNTRTKLFKKSRIIIFAYTILFLILCFTASLEKYLFSIFMILASILSVRIVKYVTIKKKYQEKSNILISLLSKVSYEIYLVQYPIIFFFQGIEISACLKLLLIIAITIISSALLHLLINGFSINRIIKLGCLIILIAVGGFFLVTEKDTTAEMKELEQKLNETSIIMEEKNQELLNSLESEPNDSVSEEVENTQLTEAEITQQIKNLQITGVGDSVLLSAVDSLYATFPNGYFDGKVSRTIKTAEPIIADLESKGILHDIVVFNLANNGDYSNALNRELLALVGDRQVYWMNAVGADDPQFNSKFEEFAKEYPNIHIVKWNEISASHPEYFYADGIHLKGDGPSAYAQALYNAIYESYKNNN